MGSLIYNRICPCGRVPNYGYNDTFDIEITGYNRTLAGAFIGAKVVYH